MRIDLRADNGIIPRTYLIGEQESGGSQRWHAYNTFTEDHTEHRPGE